MLTKAYFYIKMNEVFALFTTKEGTMSVLTVKQSLSFSFDVRENPQFAFVLSALAKYSGHHGCGARRDDLTYKIGLEWHDVFGILSELTEKGVITATELQVGTGGTKDTFYKLVDSSIEITVKLNPPALEK